MDTTGYIRIVIIDDHPIFREGVARVLNCEPNIEIVGEGENSRDAVQLAQTLTPDIILLDINMLGSGIKAADAIALNCPTVKVVMLTASEHGDDVMKSLSAGAKGYILKGIGSEELINIVTDVHLGNSYVSPGLAARMLSDLKKKPTEDSGSQKLLNELTGREEQILSSLSRGLSNKEIGQELTLTEKTVKQYVSNVLQKLQVRNRVEAAVLVQKKTPPPPAFNRRLYV